jgi:adenine-specific DNA-methyltransferase
MIDREYIQKIPYLCAQIIPYIGNKRRLLPLIHQGLCQACPGGFRGKTFLDPFAGSGIVSRFAKFLGFQVVANDWEPYAHVLNYAYLKIDRSDLNGMYRQAGGLEGMLQHLNSLPDPDEADEYIARYYSPRDDRSADYRRERMFYTRANGLAIDRIRTEIERFYPVPLEVEYDDELFFREKALLLALLVHQAATHTNTSGVFKAYHKGFGGFSGDALTRILKPIVLPHPFLWDSDLPQQVYRRDAVLLLRLGLSGLPSFDVAYLDPPYNQHQYGSNYHMLNSIVLWDRIVPGEPAAGDKAGIRRDWVKTRSRYCYRDRAPAAFAELLDQLDARYLMVSYSTEGIIPFEELIDICARHGQVRILTGEHVKYPGGRQSIHRLSHNIEFLILTDRSAKTLAQDRAVIDDLIAARQLNLKLKHSYVRDRLQERFLMDEDSERIGCTIGTQILWFRTRGFLKVEEQDLNAPIERLALGADRARGVKRRLLADLEHATCRDRAEELSEVLRLVQEKRDDCAFFAAYIPGILRKIAHRKYRDLFTRSLKEIRILAQRRPAVYSSIAGRVDEVEKLAHRRFSG